MIVLHGWLCWNHVKDYRPAFCILVWWFGRCFLVDAVSQQLWQRDQQVPVLPRHAERVPPWWCVCLSCLWGYSWIFFRWCYLINKIPWNFCLHSLKLNFLGLIHFVILCCWSRLLSLDHKYLNEPVMLEYVGVCFFPIVHAYDHRLHRRWDGIDSSIHVWSRLARRGSMHLDARLISDQCCAWLAVGATKVAFGDVWLPAVRLPHILTQLPL